MLSIRSVLSVCVTVALLTGSSPVAAEGPPHMGASTGIVEQFDAARDGLGHLSLPVMIRGKKYLFILDTGCADVVYDVSFRSILGKQKKTEVGSTDSGGVQLQCFDSPEADVGELSLKTTTGVVAADLGRIREWSGCDYYGIIGMSFLKKYIIRIDFDRGKVIFLKSPDFNAGKAVPLSFQHGVPYIETRIPGCERKEQFIIDTGSDTICSGTLRSDYYHYLTRKHFAIAQKNGREKLTLSGMTVMETDCRLDEFAVGQFTHRKLIFSTSPKCDNMLGLGYLSRYVVTFDFPHKVMCLKKGKMFNLLDETDRSGLSIGRTDGKTLVTRVAWFSPAWCSGIQPKDVILEIEGNLASQTSLFALRRLLGIGGKEVHLILERKRKRMEAVLRLNND